MDNMAYLQQISGVDNSMNNAQKGGFKLPSFINIWTMLITAIVIVLFIVIAVIVSAMNKVDTKDQDLMIESYWTAHYLTELTINQYANLNKSSDVRNMTASFKSVLSEIETNERQILYNEYGIDVGATAEEEIALTVFAEVKELNEEFKQARISGLFDRTYLREMTMQVAIVKARQSEIVSRTKNDSAREFSEKADANLEIIYERFSQYENLAI